MAKKEKSVASIIAKIGVAILGYVAICNAGLYLRYKNTMKKMDEHPEENNYSHSLFWSKGNVTLKADINNVYFTCISGSVTVDFADKPTQKDIYIDLCAVNGMVTLTVPAGATIDLTGSGCAEKVIDLRDELEEESDSDVTIHIHRKDLLSKIVIK